MKRKVIGACCVAAVTLLACVSFWMSDVEQDIDQSDTNVTVAEPVDYKSPTVDGYLGSQSCAECHSDIASSYAAHPMGRSASLATELPAGAEVASRVVPGQVRLYEVSLKDDAVVHHDKMYDDQGGLIYDHAVPMDYVIGSGQRAFAYLHQQGEMLFQSPLNWYTQTGKWDLSPGYTTDDPRRFRRRITDECLSCHIGRVATTEDRKEASRLLESGIAESRPSRPDRFLSPAFAELSIGCERCHGPGKEHVDFHRAFETNSRSVSVRVSADSRTDPIVNPAALAIPERESICNQCHLQATARVLRYGRTHYDFRPGQNMEHIWTVLDAGVDVSANGEIRAVNHVQQMRASKCYTASDAVLGCTSCHDPHRLPAESERLEFYRNRCLKCHTQTSCSETQPLRQQRQDSCVECHMPHRDSNNISHVTQTDHRILRRPDSLDAPAKGDAIQQLRFFADAHKRLPKWEADRAMGLGVWAWLSRQGRQGPSALFQILQSVLQRVPDDGAILTTLAALAVQYEQEELARTNFEKAAKDPLVEDHAVAGLVNIYYARADWQRTLEHVNRALELDPTHAGFHAVRADALWNLGRTDEAIEAGRQALKLNPSLIPVQEWLVKVLREAGRTEQSELEKKKLLRMQSATVPEDLR